MGAHTQFTLLPKRMRKSRKKESVLRVRAERLRYLCGKHERLALDEYQLLETDEEREVAIEEYPQLMNISFDEEREEAFEERQLEMIGTLNIEVIPPGVTFGDTTYIYDVLVGELVLVQAGRVRVIPQEEAGGVCSV